MNELRELMPHWKIDPRDVAATPFQAAGGFSGSRHWKIQYGIHSLLLKQWPAAWDADRINTFHPVQWLLALNKLPVSAPLMTRDKPKTTVSYQGREWELAPWMPGSADYWNDPRPEKLAAALHLLAEVHLVVTKMPVPVHALSRSPGPSAAIARREDLLHRLLDVDISRAQRNAEQCPDAAERNLVIDSLTLLERVRRREVEKSLRWRGVDLPVQICLQDVWHDHVLFTGDRVTGLIDFGAVAFDSPAIDVARLLGSLVGDDRERWTQGLAAYEAVRPMTATERDAVEFFDTSGTTVSAANWVTWLWSGETQISDRPAALDRLRRLVVRLRVLADGT